MASEYWKWKFKDVQPEEKRELTPEEKRRNWWHYHKWHVVIGVALVGIGANLVWNALGIGEVEPDYRFAYVGTNYLPEDTAAALETALAGLGEDLNGDGQVVVSLRQYPSNAGVDAGMATTAEVQIMADIMECESYFFLLEDPESFQADYEILKGDWFPVENGLYLARREFWEDRTAEHMEACDALWTRLLEEAS